jgi:uncharacterized membrane protein YdjX (TVP38/TMEM64 family)
MREQRSTPRSYRFLLPVFLVGCGFTLLFLGFDFSSIQNRIQQAGPLAPIAFVLVSIVLMSVLLPKTAVSLAAGALFGTFLGSGMMLVIAVTAALLNYSIGRWWLHDSILRRLDALPPGTATGKTKLLRTMRDLASEAGFGFHLLVRLAPVPTMMISYMMGAGGAKIGPFIAAAAVAVIPQALWVHGGSAASLVNDPNASPLAWMTVAISVLAGVLLSVIVPRVALQKMRCYEERATLG